MDKELKQKLHEWGICEECGHDYLACPDDCNCAKCKANKQRIHGQQEL